MPLYDYDNVPWVHGSFATWRVGRLIFLKGVPSVRPSVRLILPLVVGIAVSLVACGGGGPTSPTPTTKPIGGLPGGGGAPSARPLPPTANATPSPGSYLTTWPLPPPCPVSATNARVCTAPLAGGNRQASVGESILFRIGWVAATQQECDAWTSSTTERITVDGQSVDFVTVPCEFFAASPLPGVQANTWITDTRYLSSPLPPGPHTASVTITYNANLSDGITGTTASGTVQTFHTTVAVG